MRLFLRMSALAAAILFSGCRKGNLLAESEARERGTSLFRQAKAAEQAGNLDEAINLYERLLIEQPKDFSAHFQLATLLHDYAEDYIGAIHHYRRYLALRPESEKSKMAQDRLRVAEQLLAPQILKKVGDSVAGISQAGLLKENEKLKRELAEVTGQKADLIKEREDQNGQIRMLESDNARLRNIIEKMREPTPVKEKKVAEKKPIPKREAPQKPVAKKPLPKKETPAPDTRLTSDELKRLRAEAEMLAGATKKTAASAPKAPPPPPEPQLDENASDEEFLSRFIKRTERGGSKKTQAKRMYVVQPGDTLFRIAEKFYGSKTEWKRIRDANRGTIDPDGRLRAGQNIVVP